MSARLVDFRLMNFNKGQRSTTSKQHREPKRPGTTKPAFLFPQPIAVQYSSTALNFFSDAMELPFARHHDDIPSANVRLLSTPLDLVVETLARPLDVARAGSDARLLEHSTPCHLVTPRFQTLGSRSAGLPHKKTNNESMLIDTWLASV